MPPRRDSLPRTLVDLLSLLSKLPPRVLILLIIVAAAAVIFLSYSGRPSPQLSVEPGRAGDYLFCSWNVENFYDDSDDPRIDDAMEDFLGRNPELFREKVDHLAKALLLMNDGRGPDMMALYEVESERCLTALRDALNERLSRDGKADLHYEHILFVVDRTGRHFAPGMVTRLPVDAGRTHKFAKNPNGRTLEGHIRVDGNDLAILASHWTSRVDRNGRGHSKEESANAGRRMSYARDCYGRFRAILTENPDAKVILCGDFNDEFADPSLQEGLHASDDPETVRNALSEPRPLALFAGRSPNADPPGTIFGRGHWSTFDHICLSRGMLDNRGWHWVPGSAAIFAPAELRRSGPRSHGEPFRFGDAKTQERGYSDHFPVTVRLAVGTPVTLP